MGPAVDPLVHHVSSDDLLCCGQKLMSDAENWTHLALEHRALMFQTGLQIALLSRRPWRSSVCTIEMGAQLWSSTVRAGGLWEFGCEGSEEVGEFRGTATFD